MRGGSFHTLSQPWIAGDLLVVVTAIGFLEQRNPAAFVIRG